MHSPITKVNTGGSTDQNRAKGCKKQWRLEVANDSKYSRLKRSKCCISHPSFISMEDITVFTLGKKTLQMGTLDNTNSAQSCDNNTRKCCLPSSFLLHLRLQACFSCWERSFTEQEKHSCNSSFCSILLFLSEKHSETQTSSRYALRFQLYCERSLCSFFFHICGLWPLRHDYCTFTLTCERIHLIRKLYAAFN